jgi:outer membrane protein assembly factor BamD (BamD/ComL family)
LAATDTLEEETRELHIAYQELGTGHADLALRRIERLGAKFPRGALSQEREAARIFALCGNGERDRARAAAADFAKAHPESPLLSRVRAVCATPPER